MKRLMLIVTVAAVLAGAAWSQEKPADPATASSAVTSTKGENKVILSWEEFVRITGYDPAQKGRQVVTVPWKDVEDLLGIKIEQVGAKTTVDLPWEEFRKLLEWSIKRKGVDTAPPPSDYVVTTSRYTGRLTDDGADLKLEMKINVLRQAGWKRIPVLPASVALKDSTLPDGVFLSSTGAAYELLTQETGEIDVSIDFAVASVKSAGSVRVSFARVEPSSAVLDLTIPREQLDVTVADAQSLVSRTADKETKVAAALPAGKPVSISWVRALPKVEKAPTKMYAETRTLAAVTEGMLLCQELIRYNILHTGVQELKLRVPKDVSLLEVTGRNVRDWRVGPPAAIDGGGDPVDDAGTLQVLLSSEIIGQFDLQVTYELAAPGEEAYVPVIRTEGVERERGYVGVIALANVEVAAGETAGVTKIDTRRMPIEIIATTKQPILLAFRYVEKDFTIPLTIRRHEEIGVLVTLADSALFTSMQLADGRRITKVTYSLRNNRRQFLRLKMPAGSEIWSVSVGGTTASPAKDEKGNVLVPLIRSAAAARELASFPVEVVYVDTPSQRPPERGELAVHLPKLDVVPVMHVMFNYYLPKEGTYTVPSGLFGSRSGLSGTLRVVEEFTKLATGPGSAVIERNAGAQVKAMQKQFAQRADAQAAAAGAAPIRVRLPLDGKLFKLEKILVLPEDELVIRVQYRDWKVPE